MKTTQNYKIDYINNAIIANKSFLKKAGTYGTQEYTELMALRCDMPNFTIVAKEIKKKKNKKTYSKLTIKAMREYIVLNCGENSVLEAEFDKVDSLYHISAGACYYTKVKSWFLKQFPNDFNATEESGESEEEEETA